METSSTTSSSRRVLTRLVLPVLGSIVLLCLVVDTKLPEAREEPRIGISSGCVSLNRRHVL